MKGSPLHRDEKRVRQEAAGWLAKHDRGLTAEEQDEFFQWLAADARHGAWFARHRRGWTRLDGIRAWRPGHSDEPNPDVLARPSRRRWARTLVAAAAVLAVAVGMWSLVEQRSRSVSAPLTEANGYERRMFDDGSVAELNRGADIDVHFTAKERRIILKQGEAHFTVEKDQARPFVVRAHGVDFRAVGTAFNVRMEPAGVQLLVTEGIVEVAGGSKTSSGTPPLVAAGSRARIQFRETAGPSCEISPSTTADLQRLQAWQPQLLDFSSTPLAEVVAGFNRRNRVQLRLGDPSLGHIPIVASIRSDNIEGFVRLVATTARLKAEQRGDYEIVLRPIDSNLP